MKYAFLVATSLVVGGLCLSVGLRANDTNPGKQAALSLLAKAAVSRTPQSAPGRPGTHSAKFKWDFVAVGDTLLHGTPASGGCIYPAWSVQTPKKKGAQRILGIRSVKFLCTLVVETKREVVIPPSSQGPVSVGNHRTNGFPTMNYALKPLAIATAAAPQCSPGTHSTDSFWRGRAYSTDFFLIYSHLEYSFNCTTATFVNGYGGPDFLDDAWYFMNGGSTGGASGGDVYNEHTAYFWSNFDSANVWNKAWGTAAGVGWCDAGSSGFSITELYEHGCL